MVGRTSQRVERIDSRYYVGSGKLLEIVEEAKARGADCILFDDELRPSQGRNVETAAGEGMQVIDRTALILDVFRQNAATREGCVHAARIWCLSLACHPLHSVLARVHVLTYPRPSSFKLPAGAACTHHLPNASSDKALAAP